MELLEIGLCVLSVLMVIAFIFLAVMQHIFTKQINSYKNIYSMEEIIIAKKIEKYLDVKYKKYAFDWASKNKRQGIKSNDKHSPALIAKAIVRDLEWQEELGYIDIMFLVSSNAQFIYSETIGEYHSKEGDSRYGYLCEKPWQHHISSFEESLPKRFIDALNKLIEEKSIEIEYLKSKDCSTLEAKNVINKAKGLIEDMKRLNPIKETKYTN